MTDDIDEVLCVLMIQRQLYLDHTLAKEVNIMTLTQACSSYLNFEISVLASYVGGFSVCLIPVYNESEYGMWLARIINSHHKAHMNPLEKGVCVSSC